MPALHSTHSTCWFGGINSQLQAGSQKRCPACLPRLPAPQEGDEVRIRHLGGRLIEVSTWYIAARSAPACRAKQARVVSDCPGCRAVPGSFRSAACSAARTAAAATLQLLLTGARAPSFNQSQQITKTGRTGTPGRTPAKAKTPGRPRTSGGSKTPRTADGGVAKRRASSSAKKAKPAAAAGEAGTPASPASGRRGRRSSQGASASRAARAAAAAPAEDDWQEQQEQAAGSGGWCSIM